MTINFYHLPKASIILLITWLFPYGSLWTVTLSKPLLMIHELGFSEESVTRLMHSVTGLKYILAVFSAILADTLWGKYKTLVIITFLTNLLCQPLAMLSVMPHVSRRIRKLSFIISTAFEAAVRTYTVLFLPFVSEQFRMPDEKEALRKFYFVYFMACNLLNVLFLFIGPMLVHLFSCFGKPCYLIPWTYDYLSTIIFLVVLVVCKRYFRIVIPTRSVVIEAVRCIRHACYVKMKSHEEKGHFIDFAEDKYDESMREDVKRLLKVAVFYIPIVGYYTLYWQMMTKWVFQASNMDGDIGYYVVLPAQTVALNPLLILIFVPFLETVMFPWFDKIGLLYTPLQRLGFAWFLLIMAFVCAGLVQWDIEKRLYDPTSKGSCQITIFNPTNNDIQIVSSKINGVIPSNRLQVYNNVPTNGSMSFKINLIQDGLNYEEIISLKEFKSSTFIFEKGLREINGANNLKKWIGTQPQLNVISLENVKLTFSDKIKSSTIDLEKYKRQVVNINSGLLKVYNGSSLIHSKKLAPGGVYLMMVWKKEDDMAAETFNLIDPPSVHIIWILPQFLFQSMAEAFQYISLMLFVYTQAPPSMRSVVMSFLLVSQACGNIMIAIIATIPNCDNSVETFISAGFLTLCLFLFIFLAKRYTYQTITD